MLNEEVRNESSHPSPLSSLESDKCIYTNTQVSADASLFHHDLAQFLQPTAESAAFPGSLPGQSRSMGFVSCSPGRVLALKT